MIGESLTIEGPGASQLDVDAGGSSRVFDITSSSATVTLSGLTISGGTAADGGGFSTREACSRSPTMTSPMTRQSGSIRVTRRRGEARRSRTAVHFMCRAASFKTTAQGAVGSSGGSDFINGQGGDGSGGAIFADTGTILSVSGTAFLDNQANGGAGGDGGNGVLNGFGGNANGGVIDALSNSLSVTDSSFTGDLARGAGGLGQGDSFSANGVGGNVNGTINLDTLSTAATFTFTGDTFTQEQAIGGAGAPGYGDSGGLVSGVINVNDIQPALSLTNCTFTGNIAQGGAGSSSPDGGGPGGSVVGDAVYTSGNLLVSGSTFIGNQAIGGAGGNGGTDGSGGAGGLAEGAAIMAQGDPTSYPYNPPFPPSTLTSCSFAFDQSLGGAGGNGGEGGAGGLAHGGDVVMQGFGSVSSSVFSGSLAAGGAGGDGGAGGTGGAGGYALGGSLDLVNVLSSNYNIAEVTDSVTSTTVIGAIARGGNGGYGGSGGNGGLAQGGGIAAHVQSTTAILSIAISGSIFAANDALGGFGGLGSADGNGGNAEGGGVYVDPSSMIALSGVLITGNQAVGGFAGADGSGGSGQGGGIYLAGSGSTEKKTVIAGNFASTDYDDEYGTFS